MTDESRPIATPSQTVGPFFHFGLATNKALGRIAAADAAGEHIRLKIRVLDGDGAAVPDALVELYQADADGVYARPLFTGFGRLPTGEDGMCTFDTIIPGAVAQPAGEPLAPHINVCLLARGLLRQVYTRLYFHGHSLNDTDPILALVPPDRRETLMAVPITGEPGQWELAIRLQGEGETVFFDL